MADAVFGAEGKVRFRLEDREQPCVLAITGTPTISVALSARPGSKPQCAKAPAAAWAHLAVGTGSKGAHRFDQGGPSAQLFLPGRAGPAAGVGSARGKAQPPM